MNADMTHRRCLEPKPVALAPIAIGGTPAPLASAIFIDQPFAILRLWPLFLALSIPTACLHGPATTDAPADPLEGEPSWMPLGDDYRQSPLSPESGTLPFMPQPRWFSGFSKEVGEAEWRSFGKKMQKYFPGFESRGMKREGHLIIQNSPPYPGNVREIPLVDQGARIEIRFSPSDEPSTLNLRITLKAGLRALWCENNYRFGNVLPFLFALFADGRAIKIPQGEWGRMGGVKWMERLVPVGESKTWNVQVDMLSVERLAGPSLPSIVTVVAVFSERQHWVYLGDGIMDFETDPEGMDEYKGPQILVRSNSVDLVRAKGGWQCRK